MTSKPSMQVEACPRCGCIILLRHLDLDANHLEITYECFDCSYKRTVDLFFPYTGGEES